MANFNLTHTGQQVNDAITQVRDGTFARTYDSVAALLTYLQGLTTLPAVGTTYTVHGRAAKGDTPTRVFEIKQGTHTDDGGMIRTISGTDHIEMLDWDGDIRDYGAQAVSISDQASFDSTAAIAAALGTGRDILIPDLNRAGTNPAYYFKMEGKVVISTANGMRNGQRIRGEGGKSSICIQPDDGVDYPGAFDVRLFDIVFDGIDFRGAQNHAWYDPTNTTIPAGKNVDQSGYAGGAVIRGNGFDRTKILNCTFRYFNLGNDPQTSPSLIGFQTITGLTVKNCVFKDNYGCDDIFVNSAAGRTIIADNISTDDSRAFCTLASLNSDTRISQSAEVTATSFSVASQTVTVTKNSHGLSNGDRIIVEGTTGGDGEPINTDIHESRGVTNVTTNTFDFTVENLGTGYGGTLKYRTTKDVTASTSHHIITGNQVHRGIATANGKTGGTYGLTVHYQGGVSHSVITNNVFKGGTRWGIYLRGNDGSNLGTEFGTAQTGPDIISNNIISRYGGRVDMGVVGTNELYQGGIQLDNTMGAIIEGNILEDIGYSPDGSEGSQFASGMALLRSGNDIQISNNIIRRVYGNGIAIAPTVSESDTTGDGFNLENLRIHGNHFSTCYKHALTVNTRSSVDSLRSVFILNNYFEYEKIANATVDGYALVNLLIKKNAGTSGSAGKEVYYEFSSNTLHGNNNCRGLLIAVPEESNALISGNEFINLTRGIKSHNASLLTGDSGDTDYVPHRVIGEKYQIEKNHFRNVDLAFDFDTTGNYQASFVHPSNTFLTDDGQTNETGIAQNLARTGGGAGFHLVVLGELAGFDASGNRLLKIYSSSPPTNQQYRVGDVVINNEPAVGEPYAWVCTTAGTPGTWTPAATL